MAMQSTTSIALTSLVLSLVVVVTQAAGVGSKYDRGGKANNNPKAENMVVETCKNMTHDLLLNKVPRFDEETCVSVLCSDKRSMVAKDHGDLVVVALDLLDHRSNELMAKIDSILHGLPVHNWTQRAFQFCSADYAAIVRRLPACRDLFLDVKPLGTKAPWDKAMWALKCLGRLGVTAKDCEIMLDNHWDYNKADEFNYHLKYINLTWGLMEMATGRRDNDSNW